MICDTILLYVICDTTLLYVICDTTLLYVICDTILLYVICDTILLYVICDTTLLYVVCDTILYVFRKFEETSQREGNSKILTFVHSKATHGGFPIFRVGQLWICVYNRVWGWLPCICEALKLHYQGYICVWRYIQGWWNNNHGSSKAHVIYYILPLWPIFINEIGGRYIAVTPSICADIALTTYYKVHL